MSSTVSGHIKFIAGKIRVHFISQAKFKLNRKCFFLTLAKITSDQSQTSSFLLSPAVREIIRLASN